MGYIYRYLDTDGDGTGTKQVTGDYSSTKGYFKIQPPDTEEYHLSRIIVYVRDTGAMWAEGYGSNATQLTNGLRLEIRDADGVVVDLLDGIDIQTNGGWGRACYDTDVRSWGAGDEMLSVRWTFTKGGQVVLLHGDLGERLVLIAQDDFSGTGQGLVEHTFMVQGRSVDIRGSRTTEDLALLTGALVDVGVEPT